ncbi:unnamed protein product [Protopolystoma xenopodis]|uniref:Uncharacterized protein n=1 Tax=Protopolystoma xenopodis TaxID=117903 RepID=A0A3S5AHZ7_9PLAT|nr:unnamed protein product [Protopolystoma xenopodis]
MHPTGKTCWEEEEEEAKMETSNEATKNTTTDSGRDSEGARKSAECRTCAAVVKKKLHHGDEACALYAEFWLKKSSLDVPVEPGPCETGPTQPLGLWVEEHAHLHAHKHTQTDTRIQTIGGGAAANLTGVKRCLKSCPLAT